MNRAAGTREDSYHSLVRPHKSVRLCVSDKFGIPMATQNAGTGSQSDRSYLDCYGIAYYLALAKCQQHFIGRLSQNIVNKIWDKWRRGSQTLPSRCWAD
jgi:hypothetical protein